MKIIYIAAAFPKPEDGATIYTDLAEELNKYHDILVVSPDQNIKVNSYQFNEERNINVYRVGILPYFNVNFLKKGVSALTSSYLLRNFIKKNLPEKKYDLVLYESPPTTNVNVIKLIKKKYKCLSYLMLKDIFPQNAVDLGIFKKTSFVFAYFRMKEKKLYNISNIIGCMSNANMNYILQHNNIDKSKVRYFPNTKRIIGSPNSKKSNTGILTKYGIPNNKKIILFGGNMGKPQFIPLLCNLIHDFRNNNDIFFVFVGRGQERNLLDKEIALHDIKNAKLIDNLHRNEYESILPLVSIGLIVLNPNFTIPNFPSRILSYMEHSIPVFAATDKITDIKELIINNNIGVWSYSGNRDEVYKSLMNMIYSDNLKQMGVNGYNYVVGNFDVEKSVKYIEQHFEELSNNV